MNSKNVWAEIDEHGRAVRILKGYPTFNDRGVLQVVDKAEAVRQIRARIFYDSHGYCEFCGNPLGQNGGHMHEKIHRSLGGEVSIYNSVAICARCHRKEHPGIGGKEAS